MRTLAMEFGPKVLVNAVGFGLVEDGDDNFRRRGQLSHVPLGRPARVAEAVAAVLFLCDPAEQLYDRPDALGRRRLDCRIRAQLLSAACIPDRMATSRLAFYDIADHAGMETA